MNPFSYVETDYKERLFSDLDGWFQACQKHMA
jgi:hypothetical protein